jgi:acyl dehydratase
VGDQGEAVAGKLFEDLEVGRVFEHQPSRTITETDNLLFCALTMNPQPLHLDAEFAKDSHFGQRLVNSLFTLGLLVGLSVADTTLGTTVANLGFEKVEFPNPVFIGDTLTAITEVLEKRESRSHPEWGIAKFEHRARNQRGEIVARCQRATMMLRRKG